MYKMKLKPKQTIYLAIGKNISACEVVGVYAHCTYLRCDNISWTVPAFESRGFYGIGQKQELVVLFLRQWWHYYPAIIIEILRIKASDIKTKLTPKNK